MCIFLSQNIHNHTKYIMGEIKMGKIRKLIQGKLKVLTKDEEKRYKIFNFSMAIILFIINAILLFFLPKEIPMQWASDGSVNYTLPSIIAVWIMPCVVLGISIQYSTTRKPNLACSLLLLGLFVFNCVLLGSMIL